MKQKTIAAILTAGLLTGLLWFGEAAASPFTELGRLSSSYGLQRGAREFCWHIPDGDLSFSLTRPAAGGLRAQGWLKGRRVYDLSLPEVENGYVVRFYRDEESTRVFMSICSSQRALLTGYCGNSGQMETFLDSADFETDFPHSYPWIYTQDGELRFVQSDGYDTKPIQNQQIYSLDWDEKVQWLTYEDEGVQPFHRH